MKSKTIGLDVGGVSIRAAVLKKQGTAFMLDSIASVPQTSKGISSDALVDQQGLADAIKQLLSSAHIKEKEVVLSIPDSQTYTKIIEMPQLSEQELAAALKFEMEQYIPLPVDQVKTDWEILGRREAGGKRTMDVMIVAAPLALLKKYEKIMELVGLIPEAVETEIVSVHRALLPQINTRGSSMIIHMGAQATTVAAVKDGRIKMIFSIALGGLAMTRAISVDLGIDLNQAESYKKAYGLAQNVFEGKIGKVLSPVLGSITQDIKRAVLSYREKNGNENIDQLILSGGSSLLPGLDVYFTNTLSTQVLVGRSWTLYGISNVPDALQPDAPSYNVVIGLALRSLI